MSAKERLIVSLDMKDRDSAVEMIDRLSGEVDIFKVGIAPFLGYGEEILDRLSAAGKKVFLDLKFHDIPNTVASAVRFGAQKGVFMMNLHCAGGRKMMETAVSTLDDIYGPGKGTSGGRPVLVGVTVLTSMSEEDLKDAGLGTRLAGRVTDMARRAYDCGLDGVVASAREAGAIKKEISGDIVIVTPGIRPDWAVKGDQSRVLTPGQAIREGADYLVVGRPVIAADDPVKAARAILEEIERSV